MGLHFQRVDGHQRHLAADHIGERRGAAPIGNVLQINARLALQKLDGHVPAWSRCLAEA